MLHKLRTSEPELQRLRKTARFKRAVTRPFFPLVRPWVAGVNASDAIREVQRINQRGGRGLINFLGEHYKDPQQVEHAKEEYRHLIRRISRVREQNPRFDSAVSIKPTQFGFDLDFGNPAVSRHIAFDNLREIVSHAAEFKVPIEIDMEDSKRTQFTLDFYRAMLEEFGSKLPHFRICLQANLRRTENDLKTLVSLAKRLKIKAGVRLVKGVYPEKDNPNAYHTDFGIIDNFRHLLGIAFSNSKDLDISVATHRRDIIANAEMLSKLHNAPYDLQMLKGIGFAIKNERYAKRLPITEYVPYGKDAVSYGFRRAKKMTKWIWGSLLDAFSSRK